MSDDLPIDPDERALVLQALCEAREVVATLALVGIATSDLSRTTIRDQYLVACSRRPALAGRPGMVARHAVGAPDAIIDAALDRLLSQATNDPLELPGTAFPAAATSTRTGPPSGRAREDSPARSGHTASPESPTNSTGDDVASN